MSSARVFIRAENTGRFLFVQRASHDVNHAGEEVPPGGKRKPDETAEHAARREVKAETGIDLESIVPLCIRSMKAKRTREGTPETFAVHYFLADILEEVTVKGELGTAAYWRTIDEYLRKPSQPEYQETAREFKDVIER